MKNNPLLLFVICCAIPLILAYSALKLDWLPTAITNNGEFLQQQVKYENWPQNNHKQWTIALNYSNGCTTPCSEQLAALNNLYVALGKNQNKVDVAVIGEVKAANSPWKSIDAQPNLQPASLYLIDHMGLVVLEYPFKTQPQENRLVQKGLLKDLKKLLSYSRSS
ncbi:transmembrane cytochrome oxidase associated protein [Pseudoalteromonas nigrifaciens]|uniref:transmembrane cytochrome oxidase associated protein n=1 Tax=Pseudoalteromonas nigrifaciens TaxID=28109 RepID=UPI001787EFFF|nr:transmembrane cytochrome oxidase associated protein [Pseudoalteromonas nigrifaciens]MBE0420093.1 transmembrane cytochrome oxidase associated protein [Pseudoalteromonas nigrifaciens]